MAVTSTAGGGPIPPSVTIQPNLINTNWPGSSFSLLIAATGDPTLSYRWQSNGVNLADGGVVSGSGTSNLVISAVDPSFDTTFRCIVTNSSGAATSSVASLVIASNAPSIYSNPLDRSGILGAVGTFQVYSPNPTITGAPANSFRWLSNGVAIADGGRFSGAGTAKLTITGLVADDAGAYSCMVSNEVGGATSAAANLTVAASGTLAFWNFNIASSLSNPQVYYGPGAASLVGITNGFIPTTTGDANDTHSGSVSSNRYWGTAGYPPNISNPASNKTSGVRFDVSTVGMRNVQVQYSTRLTAAASKYSRFQFTTDGSTFTDYPSSFTNLAAANNFDYPGHIVDLSGFPGVRNNPLFGFRILTEQVHTATYGSVLQTNFAGLDGTTNSYTASGTVNYDMVKISAEVNTGNNPPTIAAIANFGMSDTASSTNITISVGDAETPGSLSVSAVSLNPSVISSVSASTTTLTVTPTVGATGVSPILVTVSDPDGNSASTWLYVTVVAGNAAPSITGLYNTNVFTNAVVSEAFTIADDGGVGALTVTAFSGNTNLAPDSGLLLGGAGANRTIQVTPASGADGIAPINIVVTDTGSPARSTTNSFAIYVRPSTNIIAVDHFDYITPNTLLAASKDIWAAHSATAGAVDVSNGVVNLMLPSSDGQDVNFPLNEAPWATNSGAVLYSSYKAKWLSLPGGIGTYISHYRDTASGASTGFGARVIASTNVAASADNFRLSIGNGNGWTNVNAPFPQDLLLNTQYTVVTKFVLSNGVSTLWINPTSEGSTSVTATDVPLTNVVDNAITVVGYCFRQSTENGGPGQIEIDDLKVGLSFAAVTGVSPAPSPVSLTLNRTGSTNILSWTDGTGLFKLASGTNLTGITNVLGTVSPVTNAPGVRETYYRLIWP